jgi:demethoxyubiquinone hydroxylase (CLK1/Coq7/Cat5 family)
VITAPVDTKGTTVANQNVEQLNSFLRGELSAVETYRIALKQIDRDSRVRSQLEACQQSHQRRVERLRAEIEGFGGEPADSSGAWGAFARTVEGGAALLGDKAAIAALEEGEDHGLKDYRTELRTLTPDLQGLVANLLLPLQEETHRTLSKLKGQN